MTLTLFFFLSAGIIFIFFTANILFSPEKNPFFHKLIEGENAMTPRGIEGAALALNILGSVGLFILVWASPTLRVFAVLGILAGVLSFFHRRRFARIEAALKEEPERSPIEKADQALADFDERHHEGDHVYPRGFHEGRGY